jgi:protoheme IX farnesyltransferase
MRGYLDLMKLRVVELLLVSTLPAMILAAKGLPSFSLVAATIIAGTLAAGSANAFNMVIESDIDKLMERTSKRPIVTGVISKTKAAAFAAVIGFISILMFWFLTTPLATLLAFIAIVFYVVVYTMALKQRTSQNIVWGGAAGCMPVIIGWAAVTNSLSMTALAFFMVIFFWTPPHFWALAIKYKEDYSAAGIPMLPVVATKARVHIQMWFHTIMMIVCSIWLIISARLPLWSMVVTVLLGLVFARELLALKEGSENYSNIAAKIFQWSITYLSLLSVVLVAAQLSV